MRLPCVLIFLAVAICPAGVCAHAHAQTSDIVIRDGQSKFQRHLRVQERAYGEDVEERVFNSNAILKSAPSTLVEAVEKLGTSDVEVPALALKNGEALLAKVNQFMDIGEKSLTKDAEVFAESQGELSSFMSALKPNEQSAIFEAVNNYLLKESKNPEAVFRMYQLQSAGHDLFEKPQLDYWIKFVDKFDEGKPLPHKTLIETLMTHYDFKTLVDAMDTKSVNKAALRVEEDMKAYLFDVKKDTPTKVFEDLNLQTTRNSFFESSSFVFWTKYCNFYNSQKDVEKISMMSVLNKYLLRYVSNLLWMKSEKGRTTFLEHDIATSLLNNWKNNEKTAEAVQSIVSKTENIKGDLTIFHNAHLQAQTMYAKFLKTKKIEPSTS